MERTPRTNEILVVLKVCMEYDEVMKRYRCHDCHCIRILAQLNE